MYLIEAGSLNTRDLALQLANGAVGLAEVRTYREFDDFHQRTCIVDDGRTPFRRLDPSPMASYT